MKRRSHLVYSLPAAWKPRPMEAANASLVWADAATVETLFARDARLRKRFVEFLKRGCWGVFFVANDPFNAPVPFGQETGAGQWASYAWSTTPGRPGPSHMPVAPRENACWIFHCRTRDAFRGRGLYKRSLIALAERARSAQAGVEVYIDTETENFPSRGAILSVGFQPHGAAELWTFSVPRWKSWTRARWRTDQPHPAMMRRAA